MHVIDPKVEKSARDMLDHAIKGELADLAVMVQAVGGEAYQQILGLCLTAAGYIAVDVSGRWPTDADIRETARLVVERETRLDLAEPEVYDYLSQAALGFEPLDVAFDAVELAATMPVLITGSMLFTFKPSGKEWWEYLDQIWNATVQAAALDMSVLPALQMQYHRLQAAEAHAQQAKP
jgi:hypothetical protein